MRLSPTAVRQIDSPIGTAYALLDRRRDERELLDLAQAAPQYPPAPTVDRARRRRRAATRTAATTSRSPGLPHLREAFAAELSRRLPRPGGARTTSSSRPAATRRSAWSRRRSPSPATRSSWPCRTTSTTTCGCGMTGDRAGIPGARAGPGARRREAAEAADHPADPGDRAGHPGQPQRGDDRPAGIAAFAELAERHDIALILDETYRSFRDTDEPAHRLFADPDWTRTAGEPAQLLQGPRDPRLPGRRRRRVAGAQPRGDEAARLRRDLRAADRAGGGVGRADLGAGQWRRERARGGRREAAAVRGGDGGSAGRLRAAVRRRLLRLGAPPVRRPHHRGRRPRARHRATTRWSFPARRSCPTTARTFRVSFGNVDRGRAHRLRRPSRRRRRLSSAASVDDAVVRPRAARPRDPRRLRVMLSRLSHRSDPS